MIRAFHPATRILVWVSLIAFTQVARGPILWGFGLLVGGLAFGLARMRAIRLLRRVRILMMVLIVLFAFFTPGELMVSRLGGLSPTYEGFALALTHGLRLVLVVALVAVLLERTDERSLVAGLMLLARPFAAFGLSVERLAVRVLLVFRYVEAPPAGGWRALLGADAPEAAGDILVIPRCATGWHDWLAMGSMAVALVLGALS